MRQPRVRVLGEGLGAKLLQDALVNGGAVGAMRVGSGFPVVRVKIRAPQHRDLNATLIFPWIQCMAAT